MSTFRSKRLLAVRKVGPQAPGLPGPPAPPGQVAARTQKPRVGPLRNAPHGGVVAPHPMGPRAADPGRMARIHRALQTASGQKPRQEGRSRGVCPPSLERDGKPLAVRLGRRRGAHQQPRRARAPLSRHLAHARPPPPTPASSRHYPTTSRGTPPMWPGSRRWRRAP